MAGLPVGRRRECFWSSRPSGRASALATKERPAEVAVAPPCRGGGGVGGDAVGAERRPPEGGRTGSRPGAWPAAGQSAQHAAMRAAGSPGDSQLLGPSAEDPPEPRARVRLADYCMNRQRGLPCSGRGACLPARRLLFVVVAPG